VSGILLAFLSVALVAGALVLWMRMLRDVALEGRRWIAFSLIGAAVILGVASLSQSPGALGGSLAGASIVIGGGFLLLAVLAPQSKQAPAIAVGGPIPDFTAPDENGRPFELSSLRGHPILLKFFRGHW